MVLICETLSKPVYISYIYIISKMNLQGRGTWFFQVPFAHLGLGGGSLLRNPGEVNIRGRFDASSISSFSLELQLGSLQTTWTLTHVQKVPHMLFISFSCALEICYTLGLQPSPQKVVRPPKPPQPSPQEVVGALGIVTMTRMICYDPHPPAIDSSP